MDDLGQSWEELLHSLESSRPRMLLRKLVDHYCGVYLIQVLEGFIHNLNNPLQILWVRSEQLVHNIEKLREALETEAVAEAKELIGGMELKIDSFVKGLEGLYSSLGFLTRGALFKERSEIGQVKIKEVIEDTLFLLNANMFFKHSVQKTLKLDDAVPALRGRHTDLCIIMLNLIQNALESMADAEEKHLTIETSSQGANVIIKVGDTGCGIREESRQDIYKPFFTTKRGTQYEGKLDEHLGIGLSLVSFLLEDYHGHVSFESIPGNTTFTLQLET